MVFQPWVRWRTIFSSYSLTFEILVRFNLTSFSISDGHTSQYGISLARLYSIKWCIETRVCQFDIETLVFSNGIDDIDIDTYIFTWTILVFEWSKRWVHWDSVGFLSRSGFCVSITSQFKICWRFWGRRFFWVTQPFVHDFVVVAVFLHFFKSFVEVFDKIFVFSAFFNSESEATDRFRLNVDSVVFSLTNSVFNNWCVVHSCVNRTRIQAIVHQVASVKSLNCETIFASVFIKPSLSSGTVFNTDCFTLQLFVVANFVAATCIDNNWSVVISVWESEDLLTCVGNSRTGH